MKNDRFRTPCNYELNPIIEKLINNKTYSKKLILNFEDIINLNDLNFEIKIINKSLKHDLEGMYFPDLTLAEIYKKNIENQFSYDITILHETIHAKEDLLYEKNKFISEWNTELSAHINYYENRKILDFIYEFYKLKKFR